MSSRMFYNSNYLTLFSVSYNDCLAPQTSHILYVLNGLFVPSYANKTSSLAFFKLSAS